MSVHLKINAVSDEVADMYRSHGAYHSGDSGLDLFVVEDQTIQAGNTATIKLGVKTSMWMREDSALKNVSFLLMPRSSIYKTPLRLCNSIGLVDAGYRGELMAMVDNIKTYDHTVKKGDRLVQAVGFTGCDISFELVESLDETSRGAGGFGSTTATSQARPASNKDTTDKDTATADKDTAEKDTADKHTADKHTADNDTADNDTADKHTADNDTADKHTADKDNEADGVEGSKTAADRTRKRPLPHTDETAGVQKVKKLAEHAAREEEENLAVANAGV